MLKKPFRQKEMSPDETNVNLHKGMKSGKNCKYMGKL